MITSIFQQAPAETTNYMVAGYAVIFGVMFLYILSLVLRSRKLKQELQMMDELEQQEK
jgi:CcmD family protein